MKCSSRRVLICLLAGSALLTDVPARASDNFKTMGHEILAGMIGVGAALGVGIGVGVYYGMHPAIKGCIAQGPNGLELTSDKNHQVYQLTGTTTALKAGEVVSVRGRKKTVKSTPPAETFRVDKLRKTFGTCSATP